MEQAVGKAGLRLQRMAEGVAKVEQGALACGFARIGGNDPRLGRNRMGHGIFAQRRIAAEHRGPVGIAPAEKVGIAKQAVLHHLGITGKKLSPRQGVEHGQIGEHQRGLMKSADQVLARGGVDCGLAADA